MLKKVKKYGGSLIITFDKEDIELYGICENDWIDISDMLVQKARKEVKK